MDLKALIEFGLEYSPSIKISKNNIRINELLLRNSSANFLPSLDASTQQGYKNGGPITKSNPWAGELSLTLNETLYDNGTNLIEYEIAKINLQKANLEYARDRGGFCLSVVKEFNSYSEAIELLRVQQFQFQILLKQFSSIEGKYLRGEKTRIEYLRFKSRLHRSKLSLKTAEKLTVSVGFRPNSHFSFIDFYCLRWVV